MTEEDVIALMREAAPFTYGELCSKALHAGHRNADRLIDRTIQKLRRKGVIAFTREGHQVVWRFNDGAPPQ